MNAFFPLLPVLSSRLTSAARHSFAFYKRSRLERVRLFSAVSRREAQICRSSKITWLLPLMPGKGAGGLSGELTAGSAVKLTLTSRRDFPGRDFNATFGISCFRAVRN